MTNEVNDSSTYEQEALDGSSANYSAQTTQNNATDVESLQRELGELREQNTTLNDKYMRALADTENLRRRSNIEVENAYKYSVEKFAKEILDVVDSLQGGLSSVNSLAQDETTMKIAEGMQITYKLIIDKLDKFAIKEIAPEVGAKFDPKQHEALSMLPAEGFEANTITNCIQVGFTIHDRVLRPARVIVAK